MLEAGSEIAIEYYKERGHDVIGFCPDFYLDFALVGRNKAAMKSGMMAEQPQRVPDDVSLLKRLQGEGFISTSVAADYDDSYCIRYAQLHPGAVIISNDRYRDIMFQESSSLNLHTLRDFRIADHRR